MMISSCFPKREKRRATPRNDAIKKAARDKETFPPSVFFPHSFLGKPPPSFHALASLPPSLPPSHRAVAAGFSPPPPPKTLLGIRVRRRYSAPPPSPLVHHVPRMALCVCVQRLLMMWRERRRRYTSHTLALRGECVDGPLSSLFLRQRLRGVATTASALKVNVSRLNG